MWRSEEELGIFLKLSWDGISYWIKRSQFLLGWLVNKLLRVTCSLHPNVYFGGGMPSHAQFFIQVLRGQTHVLTLTQWVFLFTRAISLGPVSVIFKNTDFYIWEDQSHFLMMTFKKNWQRWARNSCSRGLGLHQGKIISFWTNLQHPNLFTVLKF